MRRCIGYVLLCFSLLLFSAGDASGQEAFSFYGLSFGMSQEDTLAHFPHQERGSVLNPGYGMTSLQFGFDREGKLMEIRAGYVRPEDELEATGLLRALRERFLAPARASASGIDASLDEYGNMGSTTLVIRSTGIIESNIEHYKRRFLEMMSDSAP